MSKIFCPGQSIFVLGQNYFVCADGSGISQLISKSNALSFWIGQNILSKDKKICPMDKLFFVQRKNNFFMDKMFCPVQKDGACIYVKLLEAKISRRSRAKLQNYHRGLQKGRNLVVNDNLNKQVKTKHWSISWNILRKLTNRDFWVLLVLSTISCSQSVID